MQKKIVILTDVPVHTIGLGSISRIKMMIENLSHSFDTHCVILGHHLPQAFPPIGKAQLHFFGPNAQGQLNGTEIKQTIARLKPDVGIIEYAPLAKLARNLFPPHIPMILDTLDLLYLRAERFREVGLQPVIDIDETEEFAILESFDRVLFISVEEMEISIPRIGREKCIFSPHVAPTEEFALNPEPVGGMLCSGATANLDSLTWLHEEVLTEADTKAVPIHIGGTIFNVPNIGERFPHFNFVPPVASPPDFYKTVAFTLNPTRFGGGMKIKSAEAFGYGIPLVTTPEGIDGCPKTDYEFCRVANSAEDFRAAILEVANSAQYRKDLHEGALRYARKFLSAEAAFGELISYIQSV